MPKSDVNKEYYTQNMEREVSVASHDDAFWVAVCGEERAAMTYLLLKVLACSDSMH